MSLTPVISLPAIGGLRNAADPPGRNAPHRNRKGELRMGNVQVGDIIAVNDSMQRGYAYELVATTGEVFSDDFQPFYSPQEMLRLGIFEGKYCNDCAGEFPSAWFRNARIGDRRDPLLNLFGVRSRQSLSVWLQQGWIFEPDPRGWFQWYCRYYLGRRIPELDRFQIRRWKAFSRHMRQVALNCQPADVFCRPRQRQALLQWSYNPFV